MTIVEVTARQNLRRIAARRRLDERELYRAIAAAVDAGMTQRQISDVVGGLSQASVQRLIQRLSSQPDLVRLTPAEVIDQRTAGLIDDAAMMSALTEWAYSHGYVPAVDGVSTDAYVSGDWDDIELAYYRDLLSDSEFQQLSDRQRARTGTAARSS